MTSWSRLRVGLRLLGLVTAAGTVGYMLVEGMGPVDAAYMTVITISTVGFKEVGGGLSRTGQLLTVVLIVSGLGTVLYTAGLALENTVEALLGGRRQLKRMSQEIAGLENHVVVCGFGRVGREVWEQVRHRSQVVVIDVDPERVSHAVENGALVIEGDATRDEVLRDAGIERATVLIAAVRADSDNLVIVLSSKAIRKDLHVISRATDAESEKKLYLAGADRVVAPQVVGAHRLAALAVEPYLADFIDLVVSGRLVEFRVEELKVAEGSEIAGRSLRDIDLRGRAGALVLAIEDPSGLLTLNPDPDVDIQPGQVVVGIGTEDQLDELRNLAGFH